MRSNVAASPAPNRSSNTRHLAATGPEPSPLPSQTLVHWKQERRHKWLRPRARRTKVVEGEAGQEGKKLRNWYGWLAGKRFGPGGKESVPYTWGYEPEVQDFFSLLLHHAYLRNNSTFAAPFRNSSTPFVAPKRVLDVGCGVAAPWCLGLAQEEGFEATEIVGLDICPVGLQLEGTDGITRSVADRLSFVRHDFLEGQLPFEDRTFDYVHCSFVGSAVPEHLYSGLIEEMVRVLAPGSPLEILEHNAYLPFQNPTAFTATPADGNAAPTTSQKSLHASGVAVDSAAFEKVADGVAQVINSRFISPFTLSVFPTHLAMFTKSQKPTLPGAVPVVTPPLSNGVGAAVCTGINGVGNRPGHVEIRMPSFQPSPDELVPATPETAATVDTWLGQRQVARALLTSQAAAVAASRELIWEEIAPRQNQTPRTRRFEVEPREAYREHYDAERKQFDKVWDGWKDECSQLAGLGELVRERWGWRCPVDEESQEVLSRNLDHWERMQAEVDQELNILDAVKARGNEKKKRNDARLQASRQAASAPIGTEPPLPNAPRSSHHSHSSGTQRNQNRSQIHHSHNTTHRQNKSRYTTDNLDLFDNSLEDQDSYEESEIAAHRDNAKTLQSEVKKQVTATRVDLDIVRRRLGFKVGVGVGGHGGPVQAHAPEGEWGKRMGVLDIECLVGWRG